MSGIADSDERLRGRCLCGGITLSVPAGAHAIHACHCGACRRWHGGPALVLQAVDDLRIETGDTLVRRFASSQWAERAFCGACGSSLFFHSTGDGQHYLSAGLFDAIAGARFESEIFIEAKPDWYALEGAAEHLTGEAFLARIGAG
ncbi:Aldehyde-activating protein [Luteimonas sp. 9C]|uniref:GFA family protein n=1 Tax=Luteimonas sp. 9C TaxID=2653148 RepID=UPI0012F3CF19|nr:GFA family protein [Luteimonas sp. 9C]VXB63818.1 Aldehyde-activating protein [Luteimonas sp. 9C]